MDQQQPYSSQIHLPDINTALLERAAALQLQMCSPAHLAYLEQHSTGRVYLHFREMRYGVDDYVPHCLVRNQSIAPSGTVGEFVSRRMIALYGYREDIWPNLARQFLLQHTTSQFAGRSHLTW